jgi:hypothetical protein
MVITITIDDTHHTFEYIDAQEDTTITGAVDIYVTKG